MGWRAGLLVIAMLIMLAKPSPARAASLSVVIRCIGSDLQIAINGGDGPFDTTGNGPGFPLPSNLPASTYDLTGPATWTNLQIAETTGDLEQTAPRTVRCPPPTPPAAPAGLNVPHLGLVTISAGQTQPVYSEPGGDTIHLSGATLLLPTDFDGNGFDTYMVTDWRWVDSELWLGIFLGSPQWGWVRLADVTPLTALEVGEDNP